MVADVEHGRGLQVDDVEALARRGHLDEKVACVRPERECVVLLRRDALERPGQAVAVGQQPRDGLLRKRVGGDAKARLRRDGAQEFTVAGRGDAGTSGHDAGCRMRETIPVS